MAAIRIIDPGSRDPCQFFGIPERRLKFLTSKVDAYFAELTARGKAVHMMYFLKQFNEICETAEELTAVHVYVFAHYRPLKVETESITEADLPPSAIAETDFWNLRSKPNQN